MKYSQSSVSLVQCVVQIHQDRPLSPPQLTLALILEFVQGAAFVDLTGKDAVFSYLIDFLLSPLNPTHHKDLLSLYSLMDL